MDKKKQVALYLSDATVKKAKLICIEKGITRVNDFYVKAIEEGIEKAISEGKIKFMGGVNQ